MNIAQIIEIFLNFSWILGPNPKKGQYKKATGLKFLHPSENDSEWSILTSNNQKWTYPDISRSEWDSPWLLQWRLQWFWPPKGWSNMIASVCWGVWVWNLDTPYQWPQMLPLRYADIPSYILSASLFCTNANFELELMYCKVKDVSSYPPQTYTQHTTLTLHTPLSLICISSPLISYHINLTLYMGQCFARNIYSRHMTLTIFLWCLINFSY